MIKYVFLLLTISFNTFGQNNLEKSSNSINDDEKENLVNIEKQKFNNFKENLKSTTSEEYLNRIRIYSKDSLKTLAIKLLSIKELNNKKLLRKDISLNSGYYIKLLNELKSSEINNAEYFFLEKELDSFKITRIKRAHTISIIINIILGLIILILSYIIYQIKYRKKAVLEELSKQEKKITNLIVSGKSNKEIADELFISLNTVKTHITNIYSKLNITNRKELTGKFQNSTGTST